MVTLNALTIYPAVETLGVSSNFTGTDPHIAIMQYRPSGDIWRLGMVMTQDTRTTVYSGDPNVGNQTNPWVNQWRSVVFGCQSNSTYDVRVSYYNLADFTTIYNAKFAQYNHPGIAYREAALAILNSNPIASHEGSAITRNNSPAVGSNYLIASPTGRAGADGSVLNPLSIQAACDLGGPGVTILLRGGTYNFGAIDSRVSNLNITKSGTSQDYFTIQPYEDEIPIFDGAGRTSVDQEAAMISMKNCSFVRFRGITLGNSYAPSLAVWGLGRNTDQSLATQGQGNIIEDCNFYDFRTGCHISLQQGGGKNIIIQRNKFSQEVNVDNSYMIHLWYPGHGVVIADNDFESNIGAFRDAIGGGPENNISYTAEYDVYRNSSLGHSDDAFQIEGACKNYRCWENSVRGGFIGIAFAPCLIGPMVVARNIVMDASSGAYKCGDNSYGHIYSFHNTLLGTKGVFQTNAGIQNFHQRNCIMDTTNYVIELYNQDSNNDVDNDLCFTTKATERFKWNNVRYNTLEAFQAGKGQELHGIWGEATFFNKASGDLRLVPGSLGIDAGDIIAGINDEGSPWAPTDGSAPDLGAIESDGAAPPPTADFTADKTSGPAPLTVTFTNRSTGAIDDILWDFGDGLTSSATNPTHTFNIANQIFQVKLTVTGPGGSNSMTMDIEIGAATVSHTLEISHTDGGHTIPAAGQYSYVEGATVNLTAVPDDDYMFVEWTENGTLAESANIDVLMNTDRNIRAVFAAKPVAEVMITVTAGEGGTTDPVPGTYPIGTVFNVTAIPFTGYTFDHWEGVTGTNSLNPFLSISSPTNISILAVFSKIPDDSGNNNNATVLTAGGILIAGILAAAIRGK